jgi:uncharacterized protein YkwD
MFVSSMRNDGVTGSSDTQKKHNTESISGNFPSPTKIFETGLINPVAGKTFQKECLDMHNNYRSQHGVDILEWDDCLGELATQDSSQCGMRHTQESQNLAWGYQSATKALEAWYNEGNGYDYTVNHMQVCIFRACMVNMSTNQTGW